MSKNIDYMFMMNYVDTFFANNSIINSDDIINYIMHDNDLNELSLYLKLLLKLCLLNKS